MVFSSLFFIYVFLPLNLFLYYLVKDIRTKNLVMLVSSLIFYSWNGPQYLLLLLFMTANAYFSARFIEDMPNDKKKILIISLALSLLVLGYFKYAGFFAGIFNFFSPLDIAIPSIVLPIGISFYTFQLISYVIDVYRAEVKSQRDFFTLLLYVSLFHQCIAGPIVRYADVEFDINYRKISYIEVKNGVKRFCIGLAKKSVLANGLALVADKYLITNDLQALAKVPALGLWLGALAFLFQIYFDFSAYSDMAIGMGLMTGFHYKENFDHPYEAKSITDFWRRWHISLSSFFRDYVYIPLGGNRKGNIYINLLIVWFLTGMWHGASWNYIVWGLYYFILIAIERRFILEKLEKLPKIFTWACTFILVLFGWVIFKFEDLESLLVAIKGMFALNSNSLFDVSVGLSFKNNIFLFIFAGFACTSLFTNIYKKIRAKSKNMGGLKLAQALYDALMPWILLIISTLSLIGNSYNPFLYFQF